MYNEATAKPTAKHVEEKAIIFGENMRAARNEMGLTGKEFAMLLDVTPSYVCLIERGERSPSFALILKISNLVGKDLYGMLTPIKSSQWSKQNKLKNDVERKRTHITKILTTLNSDELDFVRAFLTSLVFLSRNRYKDSGEGDGGME